MRMVRIFAFALLVTGLWSAAPVSAQPLGTYRWQLQPYCNIISVAVVQQGGQYQLDGTDDQCGQVEAAGVRGLAFVNPNGLVGFGLTIVTAPGGAPVHVDATISIADLNGTWRDSAGNTGIFIFTPGAAIPGDPRPVPSGGLAPSSVTTVQIAPAAVTSAQIATNAVTSASIANGSVTTADLAAPTRLESRPTLEGVELTTTATTIESIQVPVPAAGRVMVTVSGNFQLSGGHFAQCSLTTGANIEGSGRVEAQTSAAGTTFVPFSITRTFAVAAAGTFTANYNCRQTGASGVFAYEVQTSALFVAQ